MRPHKIVKRTSEWIVALNEYGEVVVHAADCEGCLAGQPPDEPPSVGEAIREAARAFVTATEFLTTNDWSDEDWVIAGARRRLLSHLLVTAATPRGDLPYADTGKEDAR